MTKNKIIFLNVTLINLSDKKKNKMINHKKNPYILKFSLQTNTLLILYSTH